MRAHRLGLAARHFADVTLMGPVKKRGVWSPLPREPWIKPFESKNLPKFFHTTRELVEAADGEVLIAVKPYLASYGVALLAGQCRKVPVILDIDDLDAALVRQPDVELKHTFQDLRDPASMIYLEVFSRATGAASAITVASTALQKRFGGTLVPHGCPTEQFDPAVIDREAARRQFGFPGPVVLFPGTRRTHKGLKTLARAVAQIPGARLAVLCRPDDYSEPKWNDFPLIRLPVMPYASLPALLAAADVVAIPQLETEGARHQMPMKVYDAMAMGKPIVASTVSDLPLALEGCARLVPPGDVGQLTAALRQLLENPAEARALGEQARTRCREKYSMQRVADSLLEAVTRARAT
jgi:glycosyltransferase involved in cell wall biosynthesis